MKKNYIGENIRIYRERANLTQQQLADRIGISWEMVSRYERNENKPHQKLDEISEALNVSKSQLLEKHIPEKYNNMEYKVPLFLQLPKSNRFIPNQTNYYYVCPEWIYKRDRKCIAIDTSLIDSDYDHFQKDGVVYISTELEPKRNDLILIKDSSKLLTKKYQTKHTNILGKVLAQEIRY